MKIAYEIEKEAVRIWRCYTYGNEAEIPEQLEGLPVRELAPYAFSAHMDEKKLEKGLESGSIRLWGEEEAPALKGMALQALYLPETLEKIGAYAFYNCNALEKLYFHGSLRDLGAGLFTGCHHLNYLEVMLQEGDVSCLRDILMEVSEKMQVVFRGAWEAQVLFPEFFEEGTENTPARNLSSTIHGSGMNYRLCFSQKRFDFPAYDSKFYWATVTEDIETVLDIAQQRLRFPMELKEEARKSYETWLKEHLEEAVEICVRKKHMQEIIWMTENYVLVHADARGLLQAMTALAGELGFAEGAGYLLDLTHRHFRPAARSFEL